MTSFSMLMALTMFMSLMFALAAHMLPKRKKDKEKSSPYECGFDPLKSARLPFSFRFFLVAILFLLFDLEIALLFPLPMAMSMASPSLTMMISSTFMTMLTLGLVFEWMKGGLEWAE